jgi:hypothetical protein
MNIYDLHDSMKNNGHYVKLTYNVKSQSIQLSNNGKTFITKTLPKSANKLQQSGLASAGSDHVFGWYGVEVAGGKNERN